MRGVVTAAVESQDHELLTVRVPRGTGIGLNAELDLSVVGHAREQSFPSLRDGKRVVNTTASLEAGTQVFKG